MEETSPQPTPEASDDSNATEFIISNPEESVKTQDSETKKGEMKSDRGTMKSDRDSTYMDAVKNGDTETAQRMVDEAAKQAGYDKKSISRNRSVWVYYGTNASF